MLPQRDIIMLLNQTYLVKAYSLLFYNELKNKSTFLSPLESDTYMNFHLCNLTTNQYYLFL